MKKTGVFFWLGIVSLILIFSFAGCGGGGGGNNSPAPGTSSGGGGSNNQTVNISGRVYKGDKNHPVPAEVVVALGGKAYAITAGADGKFNFDLQLFLPASGTITASFQGGMTGGPLTITGPYFTELLIS